MDSHELSQLQDETISLEIPQDGFDLLSERLGWGNFGDVILAMLKPGASELEGPVEVAAKRLRTKNAKMKSKLVASWLGNQTRVWSSFNHENILKFIGYYADEDFMVVYLFHPYLRNGNAETYLKSGQSTMDERVALLKDTMMSLDYLHNLSPLVVHGNLRAANVLINDNHQAVLSDIGLHTLRNRVELIGGWGLEIPEGWLSPESLSTSDRTTKSDIWAWGCLALEMMTGNHPNYGSWMASEIKDRILSGQTPEPDPPPENWPNGLLELVRRCWSFRPEDRPNIRTCVDSLDITPSLTACLSEEGLEFLESSFIARNRLQFEANRILHEAENRKTEIAKLSPFDALVVVKKVELHEVLWARQGSNSSRIFSFPGLDALYNKRLAQHMAIWSSLKHENILTFIGYSVTFGFGAASLVAPYMANGNLIDYTQKNIDMDGRLELAGDTMSGLQYLHNREPPVVHGNITPFNVLINNTGKAILSDVGLAEIDRHPISTTPRASGRWSSPEVSIGNLATVQSDIWSWACVVLQLVTGDPPYAYIQNEDQVKAVISGRGRVRLTPEAFHELGELPDVFVRLLQRCWDLNSLQRPKADECMDRLNSIAQIKLDVPSETEEQAVIPSSDSDSNAYITSVSPQPICINGRFGDVFWGIHKTKGEMALKRLRIGGTSIDGEVIRRFEREAETWRHLEHPHILKFLGTYKADSHLYFISPFAKNGTLSEYIRDHPDVNRVRLLHETSDAVVYLHRENIVHGDIKASNLLISDGGHILLCDFGLAKSTYAQTSTALKGAGTFRWQSPELWDNEPRTFASDVYAFSMTIVEVLTGLPPFSHLEHEVAVVMAVYRDERPEKIPLESNGVSYETAWKVAEACWPRAPADRISMSDAFGLLSVDPSLV